MPSVNYDFWRFRLFALEKKSAVEVGWEWLKQILASILVFNKKKFLIRLTLFLDLPSPQVCSEKSGVTFSSFYVTIRRKCWQGSGSTGPDSDRLTRAPIWVSLRSPWKLLWELDLWQLSSLFPTSHLPFIHPPSLLRMDRWWWDHSILCYVNPALLNSPSVIFHQVLIATKQKRRLEVSVNEAPI